MLRTSFQFRPRLLQQLRGGRQLTNQHLFIRHESSSSSLHPSWERRVAMVNEAVQMLERFEKQPSDLAGSGHQWVANPEATESVEWKNTTAAVSALDLRIKEVASSSKENPDENLGQVLQNILEPAVRLSTDDTAPGYMAYIPTGGLFHSAVADFLSSAVNRYVTIHQAAPALAAIEHECIDWMCRELVGWKTPAEGGAQQQPGGVLTSGGSFANLLAVHAARRSTIGNDKLPQATLYVSEQAHYCVDQGARFVGLQPKHIRKVPSDKKTLKMDPAALRRLVEEDIANGLIPLAVVATAGTTNSGTCDDIQACADVCADNGGIWLHVDAAYGGAFALTPKGRAALGPLELADSVVVDPHKGLFMPYGLGTLLIRDQTKLMRANHTDGACMQPPQLDDAQQDHDIMNLSPELTRDFRGLKMWLPLKMLGTSTFREALNEKMELATKAAKAIDESGVPGLRVVVPPELSVFTFKLEAPAGVELTRRKLDKLNMAFLDEIHKKGNVLLSPFRSISDEPGELTIRMAILSHRTDESTVDAAVRDIVDAAKITLAKKFSSDPASDEVQKTLPDRTSSLETAHDDPVSDYRELAAMPMWLDVLSGYGHGEANDFRALDVCSGTGRWLDAFVNIVLDKQQKATNGNSCEMDFVDLCEDSLSVLKERHTDLLTRQRLGPGKIHFADATVLPPEQEAAYDLVTNMHGLYGFSGPGSEGSSTTPLQDVLARMMSSLKPGGSLVIAIAHRDEDGRPSFYDRIGRELSEIGVTDVPYVSAEDVIEAFESLGIVCETGNDASSLRDTKPHDTKSTLAMHTLEYTETIGADDKEFLSRFVLEESGANSFPTTFEGGDSVGEEEVSTRLLDLAKKENWSEEEQAYRFKQRIGVFRFRRSAQLPDIISGHLKNDTFYNDAYVARRQASSQQSNSMAFLRNNAQNLLPEEDRTMRVLSIGCGNGDLELALLDGCPKQSVHLLALEPSDEMRVDFMKRISERSADFRKSKRVTFSDHEFSANSNGDLGVDSLLEDNGPFDLVILGHVLYYFDDTAGVIERARQLARDDGGRVLIVHQTKEGIPEVQEVVTPALRGSRADMLASDDIVDLFREKVDDMEVHRLPALLDLSEPLSGTEKGKHIMSFALEVDLRGASESVIDQCRRSLVDCDSFVQHDRDGVGPPGAVGPFLKESVAVITLPGLAETAQEAELAQASV